MECLWFAKDASPVLLKQTLTSPVAVAVAVATISVVASPSTILFSTIYHLYMSSVPTSVAEITLVICLYSSMCCYH